FAGDPANVLREAAGPLPVIRKKENRPHVALRHFGETEVESRQQVLVPIARCAGDAARYRAGERRGFRTSEQAEIRGADFLKAIQFARETLAAAGQGGVAEVTTVPKIRADVEVRLAAQFEASVAHRHEVTGRPGCSDG